MYCTRGTALHTELRAAWKLCVASDEATLDKYRHFFPKYQNPGLPFVAFQQAVLREKVATATEEQLSAIEKFIDECFEEEQDLRERPWNALKVTEAQSDADLERRYMEE